ncbi:MAG: hypothetical protein NUV91_09900 [Candidatus Omnitrophica bacterium]|nr:hypothetical protein [Candidatus Omnitrophota bacterium]
MHLRHFQQCIFFTIIFFAHSSLSWAILDSSISSQKKVSSEKSTTGSSSSSLIHALVLDPTDLSLHDEFQEMIETADESERIFYQEVLDLMNYCRFLSERLDYFSRTMNSFFDEMSPQEEMASSLRRLKEEFRAEESEIEALAEEFYRRIEKVSKPQGILDEFRKYQQGLKDHLKNYQRRNLQVIAKKRLDIHRKLHPQNISPNENNAVRKALADFDVLQNKMKDLDQRVSALSRKVTSLTMDVYERDQQLMERGKQIQLLELQFQEVYERLKLVQRIIAEKDRSIESLTKKSKEMEGINQVYRIKLADFAASLRQKDEEIKSLNGQLHQAPFYSMEISR